MWREIGVLLATFEAPVRRRVGHDLTTLTLKTVAVVAPVIMIVASQGILFGFVKFGLKIQKISESCDLTSFFEVFFAEKGQKRPNFYGHRHASVGVQKCAGVLH